ncbi:MAG TPA: hypothetical protein VHO69_07180 [Phototrophicaceae bacterium]|nr:hypothetical protein [Phototrophicaceae bacterium]
MTTPEKLLARLDSIGASLHQTGNALALLGLGSVGAERDRLDAYSDLDFFAIVKPGFKPAFIQNLDWLRAIHPVIFAFPNTADGYKLLYADGIFCEFAVFEPDELAHIPFVAQRVVWQDPAFDATLAVPPVQTHHSPPVEWHVGEALTNLYVGLGRYHRGEKLSAARFVQEYAVNQIIALSAHIETEQPFHRDPFGGERRYEQRFPGIAALLPEFMPGYARTPEAARALLAFLDQHFEVAPAMKQAILALCDLAS